MTSPREFKFINLNPVSKRSSGTSPPSNHNLTGNAGLELGRAKLKAHPVTSTEPESLKLYSHKMPLLKMYDFNPFEEAGTSPMN